MLVDRWLRSFEGQSASFGELTDADGSISGKLVTRAGHRKSTVILFLLSLLLTHAPLLDGLLLRKSQVGRVYHQPRTRHTCLLSAE